MQHLGEYGRIQWNIEWLIVGETNFRRPQIDSFISQTYYKCRYGPKDHRYDLIQKNLQKMVVLIIFYKIII